MLKCKCWGTICEEIYLLSLTKLAFSRALQPVYQLVSLTKLTILGEENV
jgi:hypothetical protein